MGFLIKELKRAMGVNIVTLSPISVEQYSKHGRIVNRRHEYFIRQMEMDEGDSPYVIERRALIGKSGLENQGTNVHGDDAEVLAGLAFTIREDARNYLCSRQASERFLGSGTPGNISDAFQSPSRAAAPGLLPFSDDQDILHAIQDVANSNNIEGTVVTGDTVLSMGREEQESLFLAGHIMDNLLPDDILLVGNTTGDDAIRLGAGMDNSGFASLQDSGWRLFARDVHVLQFRHVAADPQRRPSRRAVQADPEHPAPLEEKQPEQPVPQEFEIALPEAEEASRVAVAFAMRAFSHPLTLTVAVAAVQSSAISTCPAKPKMDSFPDMENTSLPSSSTIWAGISLPQYSPYAGTPSLVMPVTLPVTVT